MERAPAADEAKTGGRARARLACLVVRHRALVFVLYLLIGGALLPATTHLGERLAVAARVDGSESAAVDSDLRERFASPFADYLVVVVSGLPEAGHGGDTLLRQIAEAATRVPGVARVYSRLDRPDPFFQGEGGTFVIVGLDLVTGRPEDMVTPLRETMGRWVERHREAHPDLEVSVTGAAAFNFDLRRLSAQQTRHAEWRALPLTLGLLVLAFGAVGAALVALVSGVLAILLSLGVLSWLATHWTLSTLAQSMTSMLGLGLGIDYALLTVTRFREARLESGDDEEAAERAAARAGRTVAVSGTTVAIGFGAMLLVPLDEIRSIAVGGLLAVAFAVLLSTTLLPGLLASLGPLTELGRWPKAPGLGADSAWRRLGQIVVSRPRLVLAVSALPVLALGAVSLGMSPRLPEADALPASMESVTAARRLGDMGRGGVPLTLRVVLDLPEEAFALGRTGWDATRRVSDALAADPRVARVQSLPFLAGPDADPAAVSLAPYRVKSQFVSEEGDAALLQVVPRAEAGVNDLVSLVRELRGADAEALSGLPGARLRVGGLPAFNADYQERLAGRLAPLVTLVLVGTGLALLVAFRALLVPLKALALNLLAVAAAFGASVLVFQEGHGASLLGIETPLHGTYPAIPIVVFCTVFGLSMDYEVFLVARVAEARRAGLGEAGSVVEGLVRTGPLITSAAGIMVVVFGAFVMGELVLIKLLGFALAVAVLVDATVLRLAAGPALLVLAGRWNWWPGARANGLEPRR
jgi:RND superfamily putative drug exporter